MYYFHPIIVYKTGSAITEHGPILFHSFIVYSKLGCDCPAYLLTHFVKMYRLVGEVGETLEHLEHTPHLEYTKKGSGLVLKKNDVEICKTA